MSLFVHFLLHVKVKCVREHVRNEHQSNVRSLASSRKPNYMLLLYNGSHSYRRRIYYFFLNKMNSVHSCTKMSESC